MRRGPAPGGLPRVFRGEQVALVGDNAIPVMQGKPSSVTAGNVRHRRAGTHPEDRARVVQGGNGLFPDDVPRDPGFFALSE
jgi:hypothetical protein